MVALLTNSTDPALLVERYQLALILTKGERHETFR